ncbi:MAG TPA: ABC-2 family transporter protein [Roseiflexaceae bacterium]|nr:ABC-2 family transporter protein [Roseiflexaceae bacterium]
MRAFRRATAYRSAYIAGLLTNAFFGAVLSFVYLAVYQASGPVAGFSVHEAVSYVWVTQSLISIGAGWFSWELAETIRSGDVVADMYRPWSFYGYWLSRSLGERAFNLLVRGALTYVIGVLYFGAYVPSMGELAAFVLAVSLAMLVSFALGFTLNLVAFWLLDYTGVAIIASIVMQLFSGFLLPLAFLPDPLRRAAELLPFRAVTSVPAQVFLGKLAGAELAGALLLQVFWVLATAGIAALVLRLAVRKVVVQGG